MTRSYQLRLRRCDPPVCFFDWWTTPPAVSQSAAPQDGTPGMGGHVCSLVSVHRLWAPLSDFNRLLYPAVVSVVFLLNDLAINPIHDMVLS